MYVVLDIYGVCKYVLTSNNYSSQCISARNVFGLKYRLTSYTSQKSGQCKTKIAWTLYLITMRVARNVFNESIHLTFYEKNFEI